MDTSMQMMSFAGNLPAVSKPMVSPSTVQCRAPFEYP